MLKVNQVLLVLTLFVAGSLGTSPPGEDGFRPGTVNPSSNKCKKDLLLIIDTSSSIERKNFEGNVQPFLKKFVKDPYLNVNEHGTRIAIILFSSKEADKTRILLNFNEEYDADRIATKIGNLRWEQVVGYSTRTEKALKIADEQVFTMNNPDNVRPGIQDVIVLVTDGAPTNKPKSKINAQKLKDKKILIVGAAIGPKRDAFFDQLKDLATKGYAVKADFDKLDDVIDTIISKSCRRAATCSCLPNVEAASVRLQPGQSEALLDWPEPQLKCQQGAPTVEHKTSTYESPHMFPAGRYTIAYNYTMKNGAKLNCLISVRVKDPLCGGLEFNSKSQVCCCGEIHQKQSGNHQCCGKFYHNKQLKKCCDAYANLVAIGESCP